MADTDSPKPEGSVTGDDRLQAVFAEIASLVARIDDRRKYFSEESSGNELRLSSGSPEASMLQDTDAILSRLEVGIARESKAMDDLLNRLRQRAA